MLGFRIALMAALVAALVPGRVALAQGTVNVVITLRGDVGQYAGMCGSHGGEDKLAGNLELVSYDAEDGTALYQGTLDRKTAVDACGTQPNPTEDKSNPLTGPGLPVTKKISGCAEAGEWLDAYPKDGIMSGLSFEDVPSGYLQARKYGTPELELVVANP